MLLPLLLLACSSETPSDTGTVRAPDTTNVLIILTDDIGIDMTAAYGEHPSPPPTPSIDALAADGVLFRHAYASPTCSPSRASLLTGRHPTRHGIGRWIDADDESFAVAQDELTMPQMLAASEQDWSSALVGKWHVTGFIRDDPAMHPLDMGFGHHSGSLANPRQAIQKGNTPRTYENWEKSVNGEYFWTDLYMTVDTIDDAIAQIQTLPEPWLLVVSTNAAHDPVHDPPDVLLDSPVDAELGDHGQYRAMVQVLDAQLQRLMLAMSADVYDRTTIVYASDNGSPGDEAGIQPPWDASRSKGTVYEGGVNVPLIITGPFVSEPGTESAALVHLVDLLPTVAEIAGIEVATLTVQHGDAEGLPVHLDGHSLLPYLADPSTPSQRETVFAEAFHPNGPDKALDFRDRTVLDTQWKLVRKELGSATTTEFYRFEEGAWDEGEDLLTGTLSDEAQAAYDRLEADLDARDADLYFGH